MELNPFHLAVPVNNLEQCRIFYRDVLGCAEGRSSNEWVDFNFFGHQLVIHLKPQSKEKEPHANVVDGKHVPIPHFGVVLNWAVFHEFSKHLLEKNIKFEIEPYIRFKGEVGEQATMFFRDPSNNALEFKAFKNPELLFAK